MGLGDLKHLSEVKIKQDTEMFEAITGCETCNQYKILSKRNRQIFIAEEVSNGCMGFFCRQCCTNRSFNIGVYDFGGGRKKNKVLTISRSFRADSCLFPCCLQELKVEGPKRKLLGTVNQTWSFCTPKFDVRNEKNKTQLKIEGPFFTSSCFGSNVDFVVYQERKQEKKVYWKEVGKVTKQWSGFTKEAFTDADNFGITFDIDLPIKVKATLIGACFLILFVFSGIRDTDIHALLAHKGGFLSCDWLLNQAANQS